MQNTIGSRFALQLTSIAMGDTKISIGGASNFFNDISELWKNHRLLTLDPLCSSVVGAGRTEDCVSFDCLRADSKALQCDIIINRFISISSTILDKKVRRMPLKFDMEFGAWHADQGEPMLEQAGYDDVGWKGFDTPFWYKEKAPCTTDLSQTYTAVRGPSDERLR